MRVMQMNQGQRRKIYKKLVERTAGIWKKRDGLAYQEKLRAEWDQRLQYYSSDKGK